MKIHDDDALKTTCRDQVRNQSRAHRLAPMRTAVLASVTEVRNYGRHMSCARAAAGIGQQDSSKKCSSTGGQVG